MLIGRLAGEATVVCAVMILTMIFAMNPAEAHDDSDTSKYGITGSNDRFSPGNGDTPFNGFKVFLSSPRHADSGSRGECWNPGRQENVNGRKFNWQAANGGYYKTEWYGQQSVANVHGRGYKVFVSNNQKDDGYLSNRDKSRAWGSDLHIVTHTNSTTGCNTSNDYLLTLWNDSNDQDLAASVGPSLNKGFPNVSDGVTGPGKRAKASEFLGWTPAELHTDRPYGDVYVELQFHDNQSTQTWIHNKSNPKAADLYGWAIDNYLNYP